MVKVLILCHLTCLITKFHEEIINRLKLIEGQEMSTFEL